jgi:hypothetical protein
MIVGEQKWRVGRESTHTKQRDIVCTPPYLHQRLHVRHRLCVHDGRRRLLAVHILYVIDPRSDLRYVYMVYMSDMSVCEEFRVEQARQALRREPQNNEKTGCLAGRNHKTMKKQAVSQNGTTKQ